jgi:hypothetical protein
MSAPPQDIREVRAALLAGRAACFDVALPGRPRDGGRLALVPSAAWGEPRRSILLAYEPGGVYYLEPGCVPTEFDLMGAGFDGQVALAIYSLLSDIISSPNTRRARVRQRPSGQLTHAK